MISKDKSDKAIAALLRENQKIDADAIEGKSKEIFSPIGSSLIVQVVEDYFHFQNMEEHTQDNAWDYIARWVVLHNKVYSVNTEDGILIVDILEAPLEIYRGFSILYSHKEDSIKYCKRVSHSGLQNYNESIDLIINS